MNRQIDELIDELNIYNLIKSVDGGAKKLSIQNIATDSREVNDGTLFICKGNNFKPEYLNDAISSGAVIYISEQTYAVDIPCIIVTDSRKALSIISRWYYGYAADKMNMVGITGTKGKTSTTCILKRILDEECKDSTAMFSSVGMNTGNKIYTTHLTTPESIDSQRYFKEAYTAGCKNVVMEVSSQAMKCDRLFGQKFNIGIFLNIDRDHIGKTEHSSMEEYFDCKVALLESCDTVIINAETKGISKILSRLKGKNIILFGRDADKADAVISDTKKNKNGNKFVLTYKNTSYELETNMIGDFNIDNITAAVVAALEMNVSVSSIKKGIMNIEIPGRMMIYENKGTYIIVDYAHNKISVDNLYRTVREQFEPLRIVSVFGCAGNRSKVRRKDLGVLANKFSDVTYLTAEDPRFEKISDICDDIRKYMDCEKICYEIDDREEAITKALDNARQGDVILIYGKGTEDSQDVNGTYIPLKSDVDVVEEWLANCSDI